MRRRGSRRGELLGALEGQRHRLRLRGLRRHYLGKWYGRLHRCETVLGVVKAPARSVLHGSPTLPWLLCVPRIRRTVSKQSGSCRGRVYVARRDT